MKQKKNIYLSDKQRDLLDENMELKSIKNKVKTNEFDYEEEVKEFTILIFHCPNCDNVFHLHIAEIKIKNKKGQ
jgi:hypothetical protein